VIGVICYTEKAAQAGTPMTATWSLGRAISCPFIPITSINIPGFGAEPPIRIKVTLRSLCDGGIDRFFLLHIA